MEEQVMNDLERASQLVLVRRSSVLPFNDLMNAVANREYEEAVVLSSEKTWDSIPRACCSKVFVTQCLSFKRHLDKDQKWSLHRFGHTICLLAKTISKRKTLSSCSEGNDKP